MGFSAFLLIAAASAAFAQEQPPASVPPLNLSVDSEAAEAKLRYQIVWKGLTITPSARVGALAPQGRLGTGDPTTLRTSPYAGVGVQAVGGGFVESMVAADYSAASINSAKDYADTDGSGSPASGVAGRSYTERWKALSAYADLGKTFSLGRIKAALYGAADAFQFDRSGQANAGMARASAGTVLMTRAGAGEVTASADLRMETAPRNKFLNNDVGLVPASAAGLEYARPLGSLRAAAGVQATSQRADMGVRPYVSVGSGKLSLLAALESRISRDPAYPNVRGAAVRLQAAPRDGMTVSVEGRARRETYALAPQPVMDYSLSGQVTVEVGRILKLAAGQRRSAIKPSAVYRPQDSRDMNARLPGARDAGFVKALTESETLEQFIARVPVKDVDDVLAAASAFTRTFGTYNYNENQFDSTPNLTSLDELYRRGRASFLTGDQDGVLVCIGSSQFAARLADALAARAGIPLAASAVTVDVPGGHAVAAVRTREYGIVFVDWGQLTPTHTFDTKQAMAIYQALQGVPAVYAEMSAGPEGRHIGYLFSEEGKAFIRRMTVQSDLQQPVMASAFDDVPNGADVAAERYKALLRARP